jgi:membrane-bound lytic murein transglycosylase D
MKLFKIILPLCLTFSIESIAQISSSSQVASDTTVIVETIASADTIEYINTVDGYAVQDRLSRLQRTIPLPYNQTVHGFIDFFVFRKPSYTKLMLERQAIYFPIFEQYLAKYNMPDELKYLSVVESGLNPKAISRAKAAGLWQFMKPTGREFGLNTDAYIDDRMHIEKSTDAACRYLGQLYRIFGDWHLALAAYNTGPGNVRRAIKKAGGVYDFWTIYRFLPKETRSYVPQFIALSYMMNHANQHGIYGENFEQPIPYNSITVDNFFDLTTLANLTGMSLDEIQKLNPQIQKEVLPTTTRNFELRLPAAQFGNFAANRQMIMDSASKSLSIVYSSETVIVDGVLYKNGERQKAQTDVIEDINTSGKIAASDPEEILKSKKVRKKTYVVRRGDNLTQIADKFNVDVYDLKQWNNLGSSKINAGMKLKIFDDNIETPSTKLAKRNTEAKPEKNTKSKFHTVERGDTLWSIAQQYGGLSIDKLRQINGLKGNTVKAGQKLKLG